MTISDEGMAPADGKVNPSDVSTSAKTVRFKDSGMIVDLADGSTLSVPLAWFPSLMAATPEQLRQVRISRKGLHWEELDEDVSMAGLLGGHEGQTRWPEQAS